MLPSKKSKRRHTPRFFNGLNIEKVAPLAYGPNPITEPLLVILSKSSICEDKISVFNQAKINNFISSQSSRYDHIIIEETELLDNLDKSCLHLCISLLNYTLRGNYFESVVLSFLAVLRINRKPGGVFQSPMSYSLDLSKFIKIAQMLVVQQAVSAADNSEASRLRAYAKKVVSNTTSLGYITYFSIDSLRSFFAAQVRKAQKELKSLLLLHTDEKREDIVPTFFLHQLQDDPNQLQEDRER
ncbi:hypothetical protein BKA63DRAFT_535434 [Paraphoma chrysanthemicola]|nr:hypothetical protein BKA63DRAFT_535434 [Paraphoma chrysanthemicola]